MFSLLHSFGKVRHWLSWNRLASAAGGPRFDTESGVLNLPRPSQIRVLTQNMFE
jgi:hypothetical protein